MAAIELAIEQNTDEWYKARLGVSTASKYGAFFMSGRGAGESTTYRNYVIQTALERITGKRAETVRTKAMDWGHETEQLAADRYEILTGAEAQACGFFYDAALQTGASPDRLVGDKGLLQIKCPEQAAHLKILKSGEVPSEYRWQMLGEIFVTGREWNDFCSFNPDFPPKAQLVVIRVHRDEELFEQLREAIELFNNRVAIEERFIKAYDRSLYVEQKELVTV